MGVVYEVEHVTLGSRAALKVLLPKYSADERLLGRFFNEARATTRIRHPGIVAVFDFGRPPGAAAYLVMELLEGESLSARRKRSGCLPVTEALRTARQIASPLAAAHEAGIVHRDLKPQNLFVVPDPDLLGGERIKVLDFGIAKLADAALTDLSRSPETAEGSILGTPRYMSPEQCRGARDVDRRSDVYSLGCILYEMLCGDPPFAGTSAAEIMAQQMYHPAPRPSERVSGLAPEIDALVLHCLEKQPGDRPASMAEVGTRLDAFLQRAAEATADTPPPPALEATKPNAATTAAEAPRPTEPRAEPGADAQRVRRQALGALVALAMVGAIVAIAASSRPSQSSPPPANAGPERAVILKEVPGSGGAATGVPEASRVRLNVTSAPPGAVVLRAASG